MKISEETWKAFQDHLGYTDEEMKLFKANPRNIDVLSKTPALMNKTIMAEVIESRGCNSQHKVGEKFYFDGAGNLITKLCPKKICIYALSSICLFPHEEHFQRGVKRLAQQTSTASPSDRRTASNCPSGANCYSRAIRSIFLTEILIV
jgi:uncharacterized repeat protein (TIGR04076 family)